MAGVIALPLALFLFFSAVLFLSSREHGFYRKLRARGHIRLRVYCEAMSRCRVACNRAHWRCPWCRLPLGHCCNNRICHPIADQILGPMSLPSVTRRLINASHSFTTFARADGQAAGLQLQCCCSADLAPLYWPRSPGRPDVNLSEHYSVRYC